MTRKLVVLNNMKIGGIQKSVLGYLEELAVDSEVVLLLLSARGGLMDWLPSGITLRETRSLYRFYGKNQTECEGSAEWGKRYVFKSAARFLGSAAALTAANWTLDDLGAFDEVISFHHPGPAGRVIGGAAEYALAYAKRHGGKTSCFVHCDFLHSGMNSPWTRGLFAAFDRVICVSNGVRESFLQAFPEEKREEMAAKTAVRYNTVDAAKIRELASGPVPEIMQHPAGERVLLSVARLGPEKGILRFVRQLVTLDCSGLRYVIVGDGAEAEEIRKTVGEAHLEDRILLAGETDNPYPYMKHADILVVPSYHEAAPVVFQEAEILNLPVFSTDTLSAAEMIKHGWIAENTDEAIREKLREILT